jgi:hypothetical protein
MPEEVFNKCQSFTASDWSSETTSFVTRSFLSTRLENHTHDDKSVADHHDLDRNHVWRAELVV